MKLSTKWGGFIAATALCFAASTAAQSGDQSGVIIQKTTQAEATFQTQAGGRGMGGAPDGSAQKIAVGGAVGFGAIKGVYNGLPVTGRPYSAQVVNESIQTLPDGNQITHKNTSMVYRDSLGRMRQELSMNTVGPYPASGAPPQIISIDDPVARVHYMLNPQSRIASQVYLKVAQPGSVNVLPLKTKTGGPGEIGDQSVLEDLGAQNMEGLTVMGTRITRTIPAGQIGNAQPINIVTEKWYSEELQITILMKHSDPRTGTTTTTVTGINRSEPNAALFTVPPDYTAKPINGPLN